MLGLIFFGRFTGRAVIEKTAYRSLEKHHYRSSEKHHYRARVKHPYRTPVKTSYRSHLCFRTVRTQLPRQVQTS